MECTPLGSYCLMQPGNSAELQPAEEQPPTGDAGLP